MRLLSLCVAQFLSHSPSLRLHMPRQGATRATQRPVSHAPRTQHKALGTAMEVKGTQLERGGVVSAWRVGLEMPLHPKRHLCFVVGKILALKTPPTYWPTYGRIGGRGGGRREREIYGVTVWGKAVGVG